MRTFLACLICIISVAWAPSVQAINSSEVTFIPLLASRAAIEARIEATTTNISVYLQTELPYCYGNTNVPYSPSMGKLQDVVQETVTRYFNFKLSPTNNGEQRSYFLDMDGVNLGTNLYTVRDPTPFVVTYENTVLLVPRVGWPLNRIVELPGIEGVKWVKQYVWDSSNGPPVKWTSSRNGAPSWITPLATRTNVLYADLDLRRIAEINAGYKAWIRLFRTYDMSTGRGEYDAFDLITGKKVFSTLTHVSIAFSNNAPRVSVSGWPGTPADVETSSDLREWLPVGSLVIGTNGVGTLTLPPIAPTTGATRQFYRAVVY